MAQRPKAAVAKTARAPPESDLVGPIGVALSLDTINVARSLDRSALVLHDNHCQRCKELHDPSLVRAMIPSFDPGTCSMTKSGATARLFSPVCDSFQGGSCTAAIGTSFAFPRGNHMTMPGRRMPSSRTDLGGEGSLLEQDHSVHRSITARV
jgi:hypothetical protein